MPRSSFTPHSAVGPSLIRTGLRRKIPWIKSPSGDPGIALARRPSRPELRLLRLSSSPSRDARSAAVAPGRLGQRVLRRDRPRCRNGTAVPIGVGTRFARSEFGTGVGPTACLGHGARRCAPKAGAVFPDIPPTKQPPCSKLRLTNVRGADIWMLRNCPKPGQFWPSLRFARCCLAPLNFPHSVPLCRKLSGETR